MEKDQSTAFRGWRKLMQFNSVFLRLFFWLLVISVLPLLILSNVFLSHFEQNEIKHLSQISDKKIGQINSYIKERIMDVEMLSESPSIINAIAELEQSFHKNTIRSVDYQRADKVIRPYMSQYLSSEYYDLFIIGHRWKCCF